MKRKADANHPRRQDRHVLVAGGLLPARRHRQYCGPRSNYAFVAHVMSMDTTFPGNTLMYRAITSPAAFQLAFALIIAAEIVAGLLFLAGAWRLWQARLAPAVTCGEDLRSCRRAFRFSALVLRLHGDRRRMVRHVAVEGVERATIRLPPISHRARRADLPRAAGW